MRKSRRTSKPKCKSTRKKRTVAKKLFNVVFLRNIRGGVIFLDKEMQEEYHHVKDTKLLKIKNIGTFTTKRVYIADKSIGSGGNAWVYMGHEKGHPDKKVAIKIASKLDPSVRGTGSRRGNISIVKDVMRESQSQKNIYIG